jgi:hypothetical protein
MVKKNLNISQMFVKPIIPGGPGQRHFSIRGVITGHTRRTTGWWIFKKTYYGMEIGLNKDQLSLAHKKYGDLHDMDGLERGWMPPVIKIWVAEEKEILPVDTAVGVTFAIATSIEQFYQGKKMAMVLNMVRIEDATILEEEVLPVQLSFI